HRRVPGQRRVDEVLPAALGTEHALAAGADARGGFRGNADFLPRLAVAFVLEYAGRAEAGVAQEVSVAEGLAVPVLQPVFLLVQLVHAGFQPRIDAAGPALGRVAGLVDQL